MKAGVEARARAPRRFGGRPRHAPGRRCVAAPIRLIPARAILTSCPHRSRIRCRSGCGVRDRMGLAGGVRSCTAPGRSGQGEPRKLGWESASSGRTGVRPPRMNLRCEKHGGIVCAAPVTKTRDLGPFRGVRRNSCPARRAVTLHSVATQNSRRSATAPAALSVPSGAGNTRCPDGEGQSGFGC